MTDLVKVLISDPLSLVAIVFVIALAGLSIALLEVRRRRLSLALDSVMATWGRRLESWPGGIDEKRAPPHTWRMWRAIERTFLFRSPDGRMVVDSAPAVSLRDHLKSEVRRSRLSTFGEHLTGIGLVLTFLLLGYVLVGAIFQALGATETANEHLQDAIRKMGAKFFVSAVALLGAIFFQSWQRHCIRKLDDHAERGLRALAAELVPVRGYEAERGATESRQLRAEVQGLSEVLVRELGKLESISVSVQGIGEEVSTHVGTLMKQEVADRICDAVTRLQARSEELNEALKLGLSEAFSASLKENFQSLDGSITSVRAAVENQGRSDVEQLLGKLQDVVSGGFHSQSADMGRQLAQFAELLPQLHQQFRSMSEGISATASAMGAEGQVAIGRLTEATQQMAAENRRVLDELSGRMDGLFTRMDSSALGVSATVDRIGEVATTQAAKLMALGNEQAGGVQRLVESLKNAASADLDAVRSGAVEFSRAMEKSTIDLKTAVSGIGEALGRVAGVLGELATAQRNTKVAGETFNLAAGQVLQGAKQWDEVVQQQSRFAVTQRQLLEQHEKTSAHLQVGFNQLVSTYHEAIQRQSKLLAEEWRKLATETANVVSGTSTNLTDAVEDLGDQLTKVIQQLKTASVGTKS